MVRVIIVIVIFVVAAAAVGGYMGMSGDGDDSSTTDGNEGGTGGGCEVVSSFDAPGSHLKDLAWDGENLWHADGGTESYIYKLDPSTGNVVDSFDAPGDHIKGLAWDVRISGKFLVDSIRWIR